MIRLSVFSAISFLVYIFGMIEGSQVIATRFNLSLTGITESGVSANIDPKYLKEFIWILLTLFSIRLYIHCWIIDESEKFKNEIKKEDILMRFVDWILRFFWIGAVALLPIALSRSCTYFTFFNIIPPFFYLFLTGIALLVWGKLMFPIIKRYSNKPVKDFKKFWTLSDLIIVICFLWLALTHDYNILSSLLPKNWVPLYQFVALNVILVTTFFQIIFWLPSIIEEAKAN